MQGLGPWLAGVALGALAFLGLVLASRAVDGAFAGFGFAFAAVGVAGIFVLIHRHTGGP